MRNSDSKRTLTNLVSATVIGLLALSVMPEIRCETNACVRSEGDFCIQNGAIQRDYKMVIGFIG